MIAPPLKDVSPSFWNLLLPLSKPFSPVIRAVVNQWPETEPLWRTLRDDLTHQPEHWLVRINWWSRRHGQPIFARADWDALVEAVHTEQWSWSSVVPALIWNALTETTP